MILQSLLKLNESLSQLLSLSLRCKIIKENKHIVFGTDLCYSCGYLLFIIYKIIYEYLLYTIANNCISQLNQYRLSGLKHQTNIQIERYEIDIH